MEGRFAHSLSASKVFPDSVPFRLDKRRPEQSIQFGNQIGCHLNPHRVPFSVFFVLSYVAYDMSNAIADVAEAKNWQSQNPRQSWLGGARQMIGREFPRRLGHIDKTLEKSLDNRKDVSYWIEGSRRLRKWRNWQTRQT